MIQQPECVFVRAAKMKRPYVVVREIREQADQIVQSVGDEPGENADCRREQAHQWKPVAGWLLRLERLIAVDGSSLTPYSCRDLRVGQYG